MTSPGPSSPPNSRQLRGLIELENDLDQTARHLSVIRSRVVAMRTEWAADQPETALAPAVRPTYPPFAAALGAPATPAGPRPPASAAAPTPQPDPTPTAPWWQREGAVARVLSAAGAGVFLLGVTFLLVLAIQHGYFGAVPRVTAGAVVAAVLTALGLVVHRRQPANPGAVALMATGVAGGYLVVVAITTIYGWVDFWLGLVVAAGLFAGGLVLARRWRSQVLSVIVVLGVVILAPVVGSDEPWVSLAFLVVVSVGSTWAHHDRRWPVLQAARVAPVALIMIISSLDYSGEPGRWICAALATAFAVNTLLSEVWLALRSRGSAVGTTMVGLAALPALFLVPWSSGERVTTVWLVALGLAWVAGAMLVRQPGLTAVLLSAAAIAPVIALSEVRDGDLLLPGLLVIAVTYLAIARATGHRVLGWVGVGVALTGVAGYLPIIDPLFFGPEFFGPDVAAYATSPELAPLGVWDLVASALVLAVAVLAHGVVRSWVASTPATGWSVGTWAVGLLGVTGLSVCTGVLLGRALGQLDSGFIGGHAAATLVWMAAAAWLLTRSRRRLARRHPAGRRDLAIGMVLAGLAVAKLMIFDLSTLDGLIRVLAFVVAGAALLALGTLYARSLGAAQEHA